MARGILSGKVPVNRIDYGQKALVGTGRAFNPWLVTHARYPLIGVSERVARLPVRRLSNRRA